MKISDFYTLCDEQLKTCREILMQKNKEYSTDDRLHTFKMAAVLQNISTRKAIIGMMDKHVVSIHSMCSGNEEYTLDIWEEKITDNINYLILLRAVVSEEMQNQKSNIVITDDNHVRDYMKKIEEEA